MISSSIYSIERVSDNDKKIKSEDVSTNQNTVRSKKDRKYYSNRSISLLNDDFIKEISQLSHDGRDVTDMPCGINSRCPSIDQDKNNKYQKNNDSDVSEDKECDADDQVQVNMLLSICENSFDTVCQRYKPQVLRCKACPTKVYPDLLNHVSFEMLNNESIDCTEDNKNDAPVNKAAVVTEEEEDDDDPAALPSNIHHRMHYLENVVVMSPKRNSFGGPKNSLPTAAAVNLHDLARLQGLHEKTKGKKGSRKSIGKSVLNRLSKSVTSIGDNNETAQNCNDALANNEVPFEMTPPSPTKKQSRKKPERKTSAVLSSTTGKKKSSRMGRRLRRTFTSGSDKLLQQAVVNDDLETLQKLLVQDRYMDEINFLEPPGVTIFHQACVHGDFQVIELLINKGADIQVLTWSKLSPVKIAVMFGHYEIAELLRDSGADLKDIINGFQNEDVL